MGGLSIMVTLTTDSEYVFTSLSSLKNLTECTVLGHIRWARQMMERGIAHTAQWRDARDMTANCHTKGTSDRDTPLQGRPERTSEPPEE
eukprot:5089846-Pyramimonas_sp.AAC.1